MPVFRKGGEAIQKAAQRTGGKFVPDIRWDKDEVKYVQFLTPIEDVTTVLMHPFVYVREDDEGNKYPEKFISRRDPALDGSQGYDPLIDRFDLQPTQRSIGVAVVLEPKGPAKKPTGFEVATRQFATKDGDVKEVPAVGLVIQSPNIFWGHLATQAELKPLEDSVFAIKRTGKSTDTQYTPTPIRDAIELPDEVAEFFEEFDFDGYLDDLASEERMHELIDPLPDDWEVTNFPKGKKKKSTSRSRTRKAETNTADEDAEDAVEDGAESPTRARRFSSLRAELETRE